MSNFSFSNLKIARKLSVTFAALTLLVIGLSVAVVSSLDKMSSANFWNDHTYQVLDHAGHLISGMVNQETGLRGYLVSADEAFLGPYKSGQAEFQDAFDTVKRLTADNPAQQQRLEQIDRLAKEWRTKVAEVEIGLMRNPAMREQARALEASGAGKTFMDELRTVYGTLTHEESSLLGVRAAARDWNSGFCWWLMAIGSAVAVLLAIAMGWLLSRSIGGSVSAMTAAMGRLAQGDNGVEIPARGRADEVGQMAKAVQTFKEAAVEKLRLEGAAAEARRQADEEKARNEAERAASAKKQAQVVEIIGHGLERLAVGDLLFRIEERFAAEYDKLRLDFNGAMEKLQETLGVVSLNTSGIRSGTGEISAAADDLSRRTEQQAASLEETAAALDEITATVRKTSEGALHARDVVGTAKKDAEQSGEVVRQAVEAMSGIEKSSAQIGQIIGVIDEIAFQTNLLALNAGVEAARAGEAGRGFAVVASEVRALAQRSAEAAKEIKALILASSHQVEQGVDLVGQTGAALERIRAQIVEINAIVVNIAASAQEQATGLDQINTAINQMDQVTQQNAAMVEESTAASHALAEKTEELGQLIGRFQLGRDGARPAARPASSPGRGAAVPALKTVGRGGAARKPAPAAEAQSWEEF